MAQNRLRPAVPSDRRVGFTLGVQHYRTIAPLHLDPVRRRAGRAGPTVTTKPEKIKIHLRESGQTSATELTQRRRRESH